MYKHCNKMKWYPWLNVPYLKILNSYRTRKGHHFLVIESKKENGEDSLIYALSRWLMCYTPLGAKSCNQCYGCRLMKSCSHPDYYSLVPEGKAQSIGVDRVRLLIEKLYQHAYISELKIVYIKNSIWLTEEAINALLKIFEEPPNGVYFFLSCRDISRLLPTLLSRCLRWTLSVPEEKVGLSWLHSQGIANNVEATAALRLSDGSPSEACYILKSDYWKLRSVLCSELKKSVNNNNFLNILPLLKNNENEDKILISWVCSFLIDSLKYHYHAYDFLVNVDQISLIRSIFLKFSLLRLNSQIQQWLICLRYWENDIHINRRILLAYQLLNIENNVVNFTC